VQASRAGSRRGRCARWTTATGSSASTAGEEPRGRRRGKCVHSDPGARRRPSYRCLLRAPS
jgi:hypothetical protein